MKKLALINIGDSPVSGISEEIAVYFQGVELLQFGILDDLSEQEISKVLYRGQGDILTVERNDGSFIRLSKQAVHVSIEAAIEKAIHKGCEVCYLHCTGFFPSLQQNVVLIKPGELLKSVAAQFSKETRIAILTPTAEHVRQVTEKWEQLQCRKVILPVHPLDYDDILPQYASVLLEQDAVLLDCASYGMEFVRNLGNYYKGVILCPLTMAFAVCAEIAKQ